jgi:glycosyltransferase involved in cell wall biosynthesis
MNISNYITDPPLISVVMPVHNSRSFLPEAIESILDQTFSNFEFIIFDDASDDGSWNIIKSYAKKDNRIKAFRNNSNVGVSHTMKNAVAKVRGRYVARMDADDVALPSRLQKQFDYLNDHPATLAVGGQCFVINGNGEIIGEKKFPLECQEVKSYIFKFSPIQQPTFMIAHYKLPQNFEYYQDGLDTAEEIGLIFKLFQYGKVENLQDYLLLYRIHTSNTSFKNVRRTFFLTLISRIKGVLSYKYPLAINDLIINITQLILVTILPQSLSLKIYQNIRKVSFLKKRYYPISKINSVLIDMQEMRTNIK